MTNKVLYWIVLGIFALALHGEYHKGNLPLAHQVADRAGSVLCRVEMKAQQTLALARMLAGRQHSAVDDEFLASKQAEVDRVMAQHQAELEQAMALRQADLDHLQERLDRVNMIMDRAQQSKTRVFALTRVKVDSSNRRIIICPQTGKPIARDQLPEIAVSVDTDEQ
jgi:hypothetical protein